MKTIDFKIKFDEEFKDYYITPFENDPEYYVWISDIFETDDNKLIAITSEHGDFYVKEINWDEMKVVVEI